MPLQFITWRSPHRPLGLVFIILAASSMTFAQDARPPVLLSPYDQSSVEDRFVTWSWLMQPKASTGEIIICDLHVAEILANQTPEEALRNNPLVIDKQDLRSSVWQAALETRSLRDGHRYAWRIIARVGTKVVSESEIWSFSFADPAPRDTLARAEQQSMPAPSPEAVAEGPSGSGSGIPPRVGGISVSGKSRFTAESANRPGELSDAPRDFARLELDPTITINGAPLELSLLLSTEKSTGKSEISRGTFGYTRDLRGLTLGIQQRVGERVESLRRTKLDLMRDSLKTFEADTIEFNRQIEELNAVRQKDPAEALRELQRLGIASGSDQVFLDIPAFGFGAVAPSFTGLTLSGVTLNGGFVEFNPGNLYIAGAVGKAPREADLSGFAPVSAGPGGSGDTPKFFRNVYAARVGFGRKENNHIVATLLYSRDDEQSRILQQLLDSASTRLAPQENFLLGLSGRVVVDRLELAMEGEINASLFTDPIQGNDAREVRLRSLANFLFGKRNVRSQSLGDISYAGHLRKLLFGRMGTFSASVRMVGPSYRSTGVAGLRSDVLSYDARYDHEFLAGQLKVSGIAAREETGFVIADPEKSTVTRLGVTTELRFRGYPSLELGYTNVRQNETTPRDSLIRSSRVHLATLGSRFTGRLGSLRNALAVSFTFQENKTSDALTDFRTHSFLVSDRISFASPVSLLLTVNQSHTRSGTDTVSATPVTALDASVLWTPSAVWENIAGVTYASGGQTLTRGVYTSIRAALGELGDAELRWEYTQFTDSRTPSESFVDRILRLVTRIHF